ncbi:hypothetical protein A9Q99_09075 [Gammaproteobacteria bacterium 45_16_T64]|nr:hypothetical protein A9Q99_09075 [Gammaproteobacteria bacterium 45_16_T64]
MKPSNRLLLCVVLWGATGLLSALNYWLPNSITNPDLAPLFTDFWQVTGVALLLTVILDSLGQLKTAPIDIQRELGDTVAVGVWTNVTITIQHGYTRPTLIDIFDHHPADADADFPNQQVTLIPGSALKLQYKIKPMKRGDLSFGQIEVLAPSTLGLWQLRYWHAKNSDIKVFPNFSAVSHFALLNTEQQTAQIGIRQQQRRGEGMEFHQLREFRQGDSLRQIDWNASARKRKIISKEYQEEKDQQIIFLLDCGRKMRNQDGELSHFDHALNAILLMAYVALKQGDSVGLMSFAGQTRWLKPVKGVANMPKLLNHVYDLHATPSASDYSGVAKDLLARHNKRSLIILVSNIRDENTDDLEPAIRILQKKHLVMVANLEEPILQEVLHSPVDTFDKALTYAGTVEYLDQRKVVERSLTQRGVITVNSLPSMLPTTLVNRYMEIKREGRL